MNDFQVVSAQAVLKVQSIAPIRGFQPPSVVVIGSQMNRAQEVFFNDMKTTEFIAQSPNRLIVRIPPLQVGKPFRSIRVLADASVSQADSALSLALPSPLRKCRGIDRLVQSWVLIFLSTPGSDVFDPSSGGGGRSIIGRSTDRSGKGVAADLAQAIEKTKSELLSKQALISGTPLVEKLLSSELQGLSFDEKSSTLLARVSIQNMLGDEAEVSMKGN